MKKALTLLLCTVMLVSMFMACGTSEEGNQTDKIASFSVGYSKVDITPEDPVPLAGFGDNNERISTGALDPICATCIAFSDTEGNTVIVFGLDMLNTPEDIVKLAREQIYGHKWKADNLLQVIKFTREGGKDIVLVNWQSHYYGSNGVESDYYKLSADYPGALRSELETQLDCHAAFVLGGGGNINCTSQIKSENHNKGYVEHGKMLATAAIESMENMQPLETGTIYLKQNFFVAPETIKENELTAFGFGDFGMVFSPWEIFDIHAKGVRDDSKYTYTFYASCADGGWNNRYLAHKEAFGYYCYEVSTAIYPMGTAELVQEALTKLINECFDASGQTQKERADGYTSTPYVPVSDGLVYTNPKPGDMSSFTLGVNGYYYTMFIEGTNVKRLLIENEEIAKQLCEVTSAKLLFDDRNIVVGIAE